VTQEDEDKLIGETHRSYRETNQQFALFEARGEKTAEAARNLSEAILEPARIVVPVPGEATDSSIRPLGCMSISPPPSAAQSQPISYYGCQEWLQRATWRRPLSG